MLLKELSLLIVVVVAMVECDVLDENVALFIKQSYIPYISKTNPVFQTRVTTIVANAFYDALAPYHPTAKAVYSDIPRRPQLERTVRNKNVAIAYAGYIALCSVLPEYISDWNNLMIEIGLNPDDNSTNPKTPIGIGNIVGVALKQFREQDGMNQLGDWTSNKYNRLPYTDYTGYAPVNTPYQLIDPTRYQPLILRAENKDYFVQEHLCPQLGRVKSYCFNNISEYSYPPPVDSQELRSQGYLNQIAEVLLLSAGLNDSMKMQAEHFNAKIIALLDNPRLFLLDKFNKKTLDDFVLFEFGASIAMFDASIVTWYAKTKYDTSRPVTAIKELYGDERVMAWGGPGVGNVNIKGNEWIPYLVNTPPHSEYPSGTSCFCAAQFAFVRAYFGTDNFGYSIPKLKGSSVIEPGLTPTTDITLGPYATFTDYVNACADSRVIAGIHFRAAVEESKNVCTQLGENTFNFFKLQVGI